MNHPNLSPELNAALSSSVAYKALKIGDIVDIDSADASNEDAVAHLRLQVVAFEKIREGLGNLLTPIFSIIENTGALFESDRQTSATVKVGALAAAGVCGRHFPDSDIGMIGFGSINAGMDYSLEYVNGEDRTLYICFISRIVVLRGAELPRGTADAVGAFGVARERTIAAVCIRENARGEKLLRPMTVKTSSGTTYRLSQADVSGKRTITSEKYGMHSGVLLSLRKGQKLHFHISNIQQDLSTSTVVSVEPDPDSE